MKQIWPSVVELRFGSVAAIVLCCFAIVEIVSHERACLSELEEDRGVSSSVCEHGVGRCVLWNSRGKCCQCTYSNT